MPSGLYAAARVQIAFVGFSIEHAAHQNSSENMQRMHQRDHSHVLPAIGNHIHDGM